jgi:hypothetical protein
MVNLWRSFHDEIIFVTNSSQNTCCDDLGDFCDECILSLMSTSLVVHADGIACAPHRGTAPPARALPANTFSHPPRPYNIQVPPLPLPRPEVHRSTARSDRAHGAPPAGRLPALPHPSAATNRRLVSPSSFPPLPRPRAPPEWPNSGEPRRPPCPGTTLCLFL